MTDKEIIRTEIVRRMRAVPKEEEDKRLRAVYGGIAHELTEILSFIDSMQEEPKTDWLQELQERLDSLSKEDFKKVFDKYAVDFNEEPVSEDLHTAAKEYANSITEKTGYRIQLRRAVVYGAKWKTEQMMAKAVDVEVHVDAGGYPYIPQMELYDYDKDIPLAKEGDKYKVVLIKEK